MALSAVEELDRLTAQSTAEVRNTLNRMIAAKLRGDRAGSQAALARLAFLYRWTQTAADVLGRRRMHLELRAAGLPSAYSSVPTPPEVPDVTFFGALRDLLERMPEVVRSMLGSRAQQVARAYSERHAFALARSTERQVTERVQKEVQRAARTGQSTDASIAALGDWSAAYAGTVYRTNLATAYTAGRFQESASPGVQAQAPAFEYMAIDDEDVRRGRAEDHGENHLALDGFVASTTWSGWDIYAPPNGYN